MRIPAAVSNRRAMPERRKRGASRRARASWAVWLRCLLLIPLLWDGHARRSRAADGYLNRLLDPGACGVAPQSRLNVDFVVNPALVVKTLQIRQQGGLRELHRFWCWPQRSSHGRDQLGYRPCTLTRGPAPKSTTTLILYRSFLPLILSPEIARRSSQKKKLVTDIF